MTRVTGKLETITGSPSKATAVWVRAKRSRPTSTGVMTEEQEPASYTPATGVVAFDATTGSEGVLVVQLLGGSNGQSGRSVSYPIIIPDKPTATLREVVENATVFPPVVVAEGITQIRQARDEALVAIASARLAALAEVQAAVTTAVTAQMGTKADKTTVEQLTMQVMATMGIAGSALARTKTTP